jgi:ATP-dependent Zn protease
VASDLQSATLNACQMVGQLGMGSSLVSVAAIEHQGGGIVGKVLADEQRRCEVEALLDESKHSVTRMLEEHRQIVEALRDALLVRSELIGDEILEVIGRAVADPDVLPRNLRDRPRLADGRVDRTGDGTGRATAADSVE